MKQRVTSFIAYFLILCVTVSIIPLNLLHHHEGEHVICENDSVADENDPCHQTIFHPGNLLDIQCEHETHLDQAQDFCEFCELLTTRHITFLPFPFEWINPTFHSGEKVIFEKSLTSFDPIHFILNRGPPA